MNKNKILHSMKHIALGMKIIKENLDYIYKEINKKEKQEVKK